MSSDPDVPLRWPHLRLLRPKQWIKNSVCLGGLIFGKTPFEPEAQRTALAVAGVFCLCSSAVYVFNDLVDRERDRLHPRKRRRPIASGQIGVGTAAVMGLVLATAGLGLGALIHPSVPIVLSVYLSLNVAYTLKLKNVPVLELIVLALGFVLRLVAGVYPLGEIPTTWITVCLFFAALFLACAKRHAELSAQGDGGQRPVFRHYNEAFLSNLVSGTATMATLAYALFTVSANKSPSLVLTVPIVYFGLSHYQRKTLVERRTEEPDSFLVRDPVTLVTIVVWLGVYGLLAHFDPPLFVRGD